MCWKKFLITFIFYVTLSSILNAQNSNSSATGNTQNSNSISNSSDQGIQNVEKGNKYMAHTDKIEVTSYDYVRTYNVEQRKVLLEEKHKSFFSLPYPEDYIRGQIVPSLVSGRSLVAPHFPQRTSDKQEDAKLINAWLNDYFDEYIQYLIYLDDVYINLKSSVNQ